MTLEIAPELGHWPYPQIANNWEENQQKWQTVNQDFFWEQLGCVPPIEYSNNRFMVGECARHDQIDAVYTGIIRINDKYYAKYCHRKFFKRDCLFLAQYLQTNTNAFEIANVLE